MTQPINHQSPQTPTREEKPRRHLFGWILWIGLAITLFLLLNHSRNAKSAESLPLSTFRELLQDDAVARVTVQDDELSGQLKSNQRTGIVDFRTTLPQGTSSSWTFTQWLLENRGTAVVDARNDRNLLLQILLPLVPWVLIFGFIWYFVFRQLRKGRLGNEPMRVVIVGHEPRPSEAVTS
jgi:cell division protease FtsH